MAESKLTRADAIDWDAVARTNDEMKRNKCQEPHLGLATTEMLLQELISRGRCEIPPTQGAGRTMAESCVLILSDLPLTMRQYRSVDG